jgi:hypothetical protein
VPEDLQRIIKEHHSSYEVSPYHVVVEQRSRGAVIAAERVQAGFDVDLYFMNTNGNGRPSLDYSLCYAALQRVAGEVSPRCERFSSIEVIPFPATVFLDSRDHLQPQVKLRIRISHCRGLDHPAGPPEQTVLLEIEKRLHDLGAARR